MVSYSDVKSQKEHRKHCSFSDETFITTVTYEGVFSVLLQRQGARTGNTDFLLLHLQNHRITKSQNVQGWKGPLWVI